MGDEIDALRLKLCSVEEALRAQGQNKFQAQLDELHQLLRNASGGGYAAGHCVSCSQARSPSPSQHAVGNDGRIYNFIASGEAKDMSVSRQQRPMSACDDSPM